MMLTKEECRESLSYLFNVLCDRLNEEMQDYRQDFDRLGELIKEHFDNPPLKWEEIKEHDFVFDKDFNGLGGEWLKVYMKRITEYGDKVIMCGACGSCVCQIRSYKEDRFYRKEVHG